MQSAHLLIIRLDAHALLEFLLEASSQQRRQHLWRTRVNSSGVCPKHALHSKLEPSVLMPRRERQQPAGMRPARAAQIAAPGCTLTVPHSCGTQGPASAAQMPKSSAGQPLDATPHELTLIWCSAGQPKCRVQPRSLWFCVYNKHVSAAPAQTRRRPCRWHWPCAPAPAPRSASAPCSSQPAQLQTHEVTAGLPPPLEPQAGVSGHSGA